VLYSYVIRARHPDLFSNSRPINRFPFSPRCPSPFVPLRFERLLRSVTRLQILLSFLFNHFRTLLRSPISHLFRFQSLPHSFAKTPGVGTPFLSSHFGTRPHFLRQPVTPFPISGHGLLLRAHFCCGLALTFAAGPHTILRSTRGWLSLLHAAVNPKLPRRGQRFSIGGNHAHQGRHQWLRPYRS